MQLGVVLLSGSVALLADTIHNFGDAATAIPLAIAFWLLIRPTSPVRRITASASTPTTICRCTRITEGQRPVPAGVVGHCGTETPIGCAVFTVMASELTVSENCSRGSVRRMRLCSGLA